MIATLAAIAFAFLICDIVKDAYTVARETPEARDVRVRREARR